MFGLPAIAEDMAQLASNRPEGDPLERMQRRFAQIAGRGACRHPDGAVRMAASALSAFAADAHAHARRRGCAAKHGVAKHGVAKHGLASGRAAVYPGQERTAVLATPGPGADGSWK
jgi:hypothetical protein